MSAGRSHADESAWIIGKLRGRRRAGQEDRQRPLLPGPAAVQHFRGVWLRADHGREVLSAIAAGFHDVLNHGY
ncbi:MAG: hypothetical protein OXC14_15550 [Rhodospirillaceae bacterium]|nr:hypothetical protein [Rhodospirillaceae bacterium]